MARGKHGDQVVRAHLSGALDELEEARVRMRAAEEAARAAKSEADALRIVNRGHERHVDRLQRDLVDWRHRFENRVRDEKTKLQLSLDTLIEVLGPVIREHASLTAEQYGALRSALGPEAYLSLLHPDESRTLRRNVAHFDGEQVEKIVGGS